MGTLVDTNVLLHHWIAVKRIARLLVKCVTQNRHYLNVEF